MLSLRFRATIRLFLSLCFIRMTITMMPLLLEMSTTDAFILIAPFQQRMSKHIIVYNDKPFLGRIPTTKGKRMQQYHTKSIKIQENHCTTLFVTPSEQNQEESSSSSESSISTSSSSSSPLSTTGNDDFSALSPTEFILATENMDPTTRAVVEAAAKKKQQQQQQVALSEGETTYPIDLPSPVLLATSMILAIISTGSLFQLFGIVNPSDVSAPTSTSVASTDAAATAAAAAATSSSFELGVVPTALIVLFGAPLSIYMLYAAIAKATAETEADDQAFLSGK